MTAVSAPSPNSTGAAMAEPTIRVSQVSKFYGDVVAVSDISFTLEPGVTALLGPNGAGKSTTLEMLTGLLSPSTGSIEILGRPVRGDRELYRNVGLVPEQEHIYPFLTAREFLYLNATLQGLRDPEAAAQRALEIVDLVGDADRKLGGFSKGMRQRTKVAAALVHDPQVILMDEPLTGTDPLQRRRVIELIKQLGAEGRTVVVSSHVLDEVERFADRILVIVNGKLAAAGNFHTIRERMDEQASKIRVRADDPRRLAAALIRHPSVSGVIVERPIIEDGQPSLRVESNDVRAFYAAVAGIAAEEDVTLYEVSALDDSLTSVFAYVVGR
ncbi:MAG TPA: ABC transporter ATP-binding protein [Thermomicrobiales bacterium]|nr:ABC transporter ATP-binding protein [Thermomicrobiales bacterium]